VRHSKIGVPNDAMGHSRRFGVASESACPPIPDIGGALFIRREVPEAAVSIAAITKLFDHLVDLREQDRRKR